ncbi:transcriptional antiterminator/mannitol/fructose-specific phosphotransferase system IIA component (Ntr-type) [Breznakia sp. PF5-3]|uniref:BglG family transcription antiterminator n=1 Tax=unclassified Breznakia TaxID=2623764 RepID=UPI0024067B66|nr:MULTISPECIES: PTS sugar transporter subunit IIA [unclassified Breznakia]MDF9825789.1 transcriptional antiterminator/mannitol/fructose-specific phosphotransferase system IIA component (Ntr-type) [Breznakia sp. PM6-1]MDF9836594.1 transcriptional antiterminator/mannitol/fructose-specific phosphotransferase system IIA component (Ntr-type) [Breznakia sp. PF5-3]MDF9838830.1 transcriptional antiterminator/mannitol/fructose-specific phosphotransferase system IIA component (Ntr-type) [Breznakia sp. PF
MKTERIKQLIKLLISQDDYITVYKLSKQLNISERTIHNYVTSQEFGSLIFPGKLVKKPNRGIRLEADGVAKAKILSKLKLSLTLNTGQENDFCKVLIKLLSNAKGISYDELKNELFLSTTSLHALINEIDNYSNEFNCYIEHKRGKGILLYGDENDIRKLFYAFLTTFIEGSEDIAMNRINDKTNVILNILLKEDEKHKIINIMKISENIINTNYCDEDYNKVAICLSIIITRLKIGKFIQNESFYDLKSNQEFYYATLIKNYLEKDFSILFTDPEIEYLSLLLIGTRKQINIPTTQQDMVMLEKFLNLLSIRLNVELSNDFELKQNLISHLKPAINRIRYGISNENPLLEQIKINYTEVYMAVITTIEDLEIMENIYFDSNEIGYICLHIIAAVNRPANIRKIEAALICSEGLSIEIFLKNIIESYFSEIHIKEIFRENSIQTIHSEAYDIIINSSKTIVMGDNCIRIDPNFTHNDHSALRHYVLNFSAMGIAHKENVYEHYLLFFQDDLENEDKLLQKYCNFLEVNGYVKKEFYDSVISRTKISSTYVARGIALPHGAKDAVISSVIIMINLKNQIKWDGEDTDFVILVAANDKDLNEYNFLFRKIMRIAADDRLAKTLKNCTNMHSLKQLLNDL